MGLEAPKYTRRTLLKGVAAGTATLIGCGDEKTPQPQKSEAIIPPDGLSELTNSIHELPSSFTKTLLQERVVPLFTAQSPHTVARDDYNFLVRDSRVVFLYVSGFSQPMTTSEGIYSVQTADAGKNKPLPILEEDTRMIMPVIGNSLMQDGKIILHQATGKKGQPLPEGIAPEITVKSLFPEKIPQERKAFSQTFENFIFVKEACTALLVDIFAQEAYNLAKQNGLPIPEALVKDPSGTVRKIEGISVMINSLGKTSNRFNLAVDLGAVIVALKAMEQDPRLNTLREFTAFSPVIDSLSSVNFGNTPRQLLEAAFDWGTNPDNYAVFKNNVGGSLSNNP